MTQRILTHRDKFVLGRTLDQGDPQQATWHVMAEVRLYLKPGQFRSVHHTVVSDPQALSIQFQVGPRRAGSDWDDALVSVGQTVAERRRIVRKPDPLKIRDEERHGYDLRHIIDILWREWHLNDVQAGCAHQTNGFIAACPFSGYRHGSAWLVRPLDHPALERIKSLELTQAPA